MTSRPRFTPHAFLALGLTVLALIPLGTSLHLPASPFAPSPPPAMAAPARSLERALPAAPEAPPPAPTGERVVPDQPAPPNMGLSVVPRPHPLLNALQPVPRRRAPAGIEAPQISAPVYVVLDDASGRVMLDRDADLRVPPASLTKIATAMVALENVELDQAVVTDVDGHHMGDSSVMGLYPVDILSMRDLLYGLLLPSGNDAAIQIARVVGNGDEAQFVEMMNQLARRLGLRNTHFTNPHGLDDPDHYSSAYDLAVLARYAMGNPTFRKIVGTPYYEARGFRTYRMYNTNPLLGRYAGLDGVKTGFTDNAGQTYVASASRDGHRVFVALVQSKNRAGDAVPLLDFAFALYQWPSLNPERLGAIP